MPEGIRCSFHVSPLRTIVWPALLPPWKRTTASACSASRSVIFPLPSSPHWAPTITMPGIRQGSVRRRARLAPRGSGPEAIPGEVHELRVLLLERQRDVPEGAVAVLGD